MRTSLSFLTGLSLLLPSFAFADAKCTGSIGQIITCVYSGTAGEINGILAGSDDPLNEKLQAVSRVLKTKHDTAKNAVGNIR